MELIKALEKLKNEGAYPMHMPGHKRNPAFAHAGLPFCFDATEIPGLDNLHRPSGILLEGMQRAARLFGSDRCFYLINGATCGILAGISACTKKGDRVLVSRGSHMSVYNAICERELAPVWLFPPRDESFGITVSVSPREVESALNKYPDIRLVIITSPTYEGVVSDIAEISRVVHEKNIPLLVDEAHGAHFGFSAAFPQSSVSAGADITVHSLHKTLPSLTQTALLHVSGKLADPEEVARRLSVYETSSPSYILMASIDLCVSLLESRGEQLFESYTALLNGFSKRMEQLKHIKVLFKGADAPSSHPDILAVDPGKITVSVKDTDIGGAGLEKILRDHFQIQIEMASSDYIVAMTSISDTEEAFARLSDALLTVDSELSKKSASPPEAQVPPPEAAMPAHEAQRARGAFVSLEKSAGLISREYVWAYPPGIPMLIPGERVSKELINEIGRLSDAGIALESTYRKLPKEINTVHGLT